MKLSGAMSFLADSFWEEQKKKSGVGKGVKKKKRETESLVSNFEFKGLRKVK